MVSESYFLRNVGSSLSYACSFVHYCAIPEINYDVYENCMQSLTSDGSPRHIRDISLVILCTIIVLCKLNCDLFSHEPNEPNRGALGRPPT